jgi:hypothetical protein
VPARLRRGRRTDHRLLIGSQAGAYRCDFLLRGFPQPFHVAHRRCAKQPLVLAGIKGQGGNIFYKYLDDLTAVFVKVEADY